MSDLKSRKDEEYKSIKKNIRLHFPHIKGAKLHKLCDHLYLKYKDPELRKEALTILYSKEWQNFDYKTVEENVQKELNEFMRTSPAMRKMLLIQLIHEDFSAFPDLDETYKKHLNDIEQLQYPVVDAGSIQIDKPEEE